MNIFATFSSVSMNIGDDIQTFAVERLIGKVDGYCDRENITIQKGEGILIANGWWKHYEKDFPPHPLTKPAYVGVHFCCSEGFLQRHIGHFKWCEPIGCRDYFTLQRLQKIGVSAYFSNCMTLGLQRWLPRLDAGPVVAVDVDPEMQLPPDALLASHHGPASSHPSVMRDLTIARLTMYQQASLVITSRLHVALPCLAFGTPVMFVTTTPMDSRFGWLREIMHLEHNPGRLPNAGFELTIEQRKELYKNAKIYVQNAVHEATLRNTKPA